MRYRLYILYVRRDNGVGGKRIKSKESGARDAGMECMQPQIIIIPDAKLAVTSGSVGSGRRAGSLTMES